MAAWTTAPACYAEESWQFKLTPYVWATSIEQRTDAGFLPNPIESDTSFSDLLDNLDGALLVAFKAQKERWAVSSDASYLVVSPEGDSSIDSETRSLLWDVLGWYQLSPGLDLGAGMRMIDVEIDVTPANPGLPSPDIDKNYVDFVLGARYERALTERWELSVGGDISVGGDTDGMWMGQVLLGYRLADDKTVLFGYRRLEVEFENDRSGIRRIETDLDMDGVGVGFRFEF